MPYLFRIVLVVVDSHENTYARVSILIMLQAGDEMLFLCYGSFI